MSITNLANVLSSVFFENIGSLKTKKIVTLTGPAVAGHQLTAIMKAVDLLV